MNSLFFCRAPADGPGAAFSTGRRAMKPTFFSLLLVLLAAITTAGCNKGTKAQSSVPADLGLQNGLEELAVVYKYIAEKGEAVPRSLDDLAERQANLPTAWDKIVSGEYVVLWGAGYSSSGAVLAHEKSAPTSGGLVLLQNGTVKQMTAAEFNSAPKAR